MTPFLIDRMRQRLQSGATSRRIIAFFFIVSLSQMAGVRRALSQTETASVFRYHIPSEPQSLDPSRLTSTDASYFFNNVMRGLYSYSNDHGLMPEGATSCVFETPLAMRCGLGETFWSDGSKVEAGDYLRSFRRLLSASSRNPSVDLLRNVKNAVAVNAGRLPVEQLGVSAPSKTSLVIEFEKPDPEFLYKLTASVLVPTKLDQFPKRGDVTGLIFNGPYRVTSWTLGHRIHLEPNLHYARGNPKRPPVEVLFIDDDETALHLYEQKGLSFLRRLPTTYIATYKQRADFLQIPVARFDYIGFGPDLKAEPALREALSDSADYKELQKLYDALGRPGCPSMPERLMDRDRCAEFDLAAAKKAWARVSPEAKKKRYKLTFSKLGGDDVKKGMEWLQSQWKKNLGVDIDLEQAEQGTYLQMLRTHPTAVFRKGVGMERPTCLSALETFAPEGSENFLNVDDVSYLETLKKMNAEAEKGAREAHPTKEEKRLCGAGMQRLLDDHLLIPLGRIHFTLLADPAFTGWALNEMNQLDLASLSVKTAPLH